jgi:hypothetical protein
MTGSAQKIPPTPQPTIDYIAGLLVMLNANEAGNILTSSMYKIVAQAIERGWSTPLATEYALDFGQRVVEALRQPRPLQ